MTLVVDASVACKWFVEEEGSAAATQLLGLGQALAAPDLIVPEVSSALHKKLRADLITVEQARVAIEGLPDGTHRVLRCRVCTDARRGHHRAHAADER